MKRARKAYRYPHPVNSDIWFYKQESGFEFHVDIRDFDGFLKHITFKVQDRTLINYIEGHAEDRKR